MGCKIEKTHQLGQYSQLTDNTFESTSNDDNQRNNNLTGVNLFNDLDGGKNKTNKKRNNKKKNKTRKSKKHSKRLNKNKKQTKKNNTKSMKKIKKTRKNKK